MTSLVEEGVVRHVPEPESRRLLILAAHERLEAADFIRPTNREFADRLVASANRDLTALGCQPRFRYPKELVA